MNTVIIFCFLAFVVGVSQADAGGKYCRMKWKCHNVLVHKCSWRIQNVCRNNCRRVKTKVAEHVAARLGVAGALHLHRGLQSVHLGAVRGQGLGHKVMLHGENGKDGHEHHHWGHHGHHHWKHHGHHHWGHHPHHGHHLLGKYDPGYAYNGKNGKNGYGPYGYNGKNGHHYRYSNGKYGYGNGKNRYGPYGYNGRNGHHYGYGNGKYGYGNGYGPYGYNGKDGHHYGYGNGKYGYGNGKNGYGPYGYNGRNGHHYGYGNGKYGYGNGKNGYGHYGYNNKNGYGPYGYSGKNGHHNGYGKVHHDLLGLLGKGIYYDPSGPVTTAKNQLCVKVCHKEPRKSCWDAKELRCKRTGKKICHSY